MKKVKLLFVVLTSSIYVSIAQDKVPVDYLSTKNIMSFNYGDLIANRVAIAYERLLLKGKLGLKIPLAVTFVNDNYYSEKSKMQGGLDVNYYPFGQQKLSYYTGIGSKIGQRYGGYGYCPNCYYIHLAEPLYYSPQNVPFISAHVNNGVQFIFNKHFSVSGQFGIGVIKNINQDTYYYDTGLRSNVTGELNASFRF